MTRFTDELDAYVQVQLASPPSFQPVVARHRQLVRRRRKLAAGAGLAALAVLGTASGVLASHRQHQSTTTEPSAHDGRVSVALYVIGGPVASPYMKDGRVVPAPADLVISQRGHRVRTVHLEEGSRTLMTLPVGSYQLQDQSCRDTKTVSVTHAKPASVDLRCDIR